MLLSIIIISLAFGWLLYETKGLTVRLAYGAVQSKSSGVKAESNDNHYNEIKEYPITFELQPFPELSGKVNIICKRE